MHVIVYVNFFRAVPETGPKSKDEGVAEGCIRNWSGSKERGIEESKGSGSIKETGAGKKGSIAAFSKLRSPRAFSKVYVNS